MARKTKRTTSKSKRKAAPSKRRAKASPRSGIQKAQADRRKEAPSRAEPIISRDVVEELLVHSAKSADGEQLSDTALSQIAIGAALDPMRVLEAHRLLCNEADASGETTVFRVVELWAPVE